MNKYHKWYNGLVKKAINRNWNKKTSDFYLEKHHIIPKSLGGNNNKDNLVYLTAREHFIAHLLLSKMYSGKEKVKMQFALYMFTRKPSLNSDRKLNSHSYDYARKCLANATKVFHTGLPKPKSIEHRLKLSLALKGKPRPDIALALKGKKLSEETKRKIGEAGKGRVYSMESKEKVRQAALAQWARYRANGNKHLPLPADE